MTPEQSAAVARVREALALVPEPFKPILTGCPEYARAVHPDTIRTILAALDAAQAPREVPRLTDDEFRQMWKAWPHLSITSAAKAADFGRAIESRVRALCGVEP